MTAAPACPPDASTRELAKLTELGELDPALPSNDFHFVTKHLSDFEQAAVVAVLTQVRAEEQRRMKRVERRALQPWQRSQRLPERIIEPYSEG